MDDDVAAQIWEGTCPTGTLQCDGALRRTLRPGWCTRLGRIRTRHLRRHGNPGRKSREKSPADRRHSQLKDVSVQWVVRLGEERRWIAAGVGCQGVDEVVVQRPALEAACGVHRQQPLDASLALVGLGAEAELAVDDRAA